MLFEELNDILLPRKRIDNLCYATQHTKAQGKTFGDGPDPRR